MKDLALTRLLQSQTCRLEALCDDVEELIARRASEATSRAPLRQLLALADQYCTAIAAFERLIPTCPAARRPKMRQLVDHRCAYLGTLRTYIFHLQCAVRPLPRPRQAASAHPAIH
jgi:hypothetical protein